MNPCVKNQKGSPSLLSDDTYHATSLLLYSSTNKSLKLFTNKTTYRNNNKVIEWTTYIDATIHWQMSRCHQRVVILWIVASVSFTFDLYMQQLIERWSAVIKEWSFLELSCLWVLLSISWHIVNDLYLSISYLSFDELSGTHCNSIHKVIVIFLR